MRETSTSVMVRPAVFNDADGIARIFLESGQYHARMDPERYSPPAIETISTCYRNELQDFSDRVAARITFVAEFGSEIVGFIDARLEQSLDLMHRELTYCHVAEIAVSSRHQKQGIGSRLLSAAEDWGRRRGAQFASLEYHIANQRAADFYERSIGYSPAATIAIKRL